jgi:hypothetical protein
MKNFFAAALLAMSSMGASAAVITDVVDPTPNIAVTTTKSYSFSHNILDQGFVPGFDSLVSALLTITLTDPNNGQEKLYFVLGSGLQQVYTKTGNNNVNNGLGGSFDVDLINHALADLEDGTLAVTVGASAGEYVFASSSLAVTFTPGVLPPPPPNPVPEPLSVALMGLGLMALRYGRRR